MAPWLAATHPSNPHACVPTEPPWYPLLSPNSPIIPIPAGGIACSRHGRGGKSAALMRCT